MFSHKISIASVSILLLFGLTGSALAATAPSLGTAASFSVLADSSAASANLTTLSGDLGLSTGLAGSRTGTWLVGGTEYFGPSSLAFTAQADAQAAASNLAAQTSSGTWSLNPAPVPGVWTAAGSAVFAGPTLTLSGSATDVWVFQIGQDLTFTGSVNLVGGAQACNVFWQVGRDATIVAGSNFVGTLIAARDVTVGSGATVAGRILSNQSVTTDANIITTSSCAAAPVSNQQPATINVVKTVINDNGGTKAVSDFPLFINGTLVVSGQTNTFPAPASAYSVTETADTGYLRTFSGDCDSNGQFNLNPGDNKFCIITNNDIGAPAVPPIPPLIDVVKVPSPLALPGGPGLVTYTYTAHNVGTVPMSNITMVGDSCSPITLVSGDSNGDSILDVNETWTYTCATTLAATHTNTVTATGWANGISAVDVASATVIVGAPVVPPLIHITKIPSPLALRAAGGIVTYTERITNPGTVALNNVNLTDDKCAPLVYISGDTNADSLLQPTETWTYTCRTNLSQTTTNTAVATGQANGLIARDFAIATVVVGATSGAPGLPNTGIPPQSNNAPWGIAAGVLAFVSAGFLVALRRPGSVA